MARPQSTTGGRPIIVSVRLSHHEADALDKARGNASRANYLRTLIPGAARAWNGPKRLGPDQTLPDPEPQALLGTPTPRDPDYLPPSAAHEVGEKIVDTPQHRHKRGPLIEQHMIRGHKITTYQCAQPGCTHVIKDD